MSNQLPTAPKPALVAGGQVAALVPQSLDEAFRVANAIAASGLAPKGVEKPEQVLVAIMAGAELGFAPFQALQSFAVINGKPNIWGDALPALLWSRGFDIDEWFDNEDAPTKAFCKITRPNGKVVERTFSLDDAKKAGLAGKQGPWQQYQKRMLQMRARAFAARDGASDVLRGMQIAEEVQDYQPIRDVTPATSGLRARLEASRAAAHADQVAEESIDLEAELDAATNGDTIPDHDAETGEVVEGGDFPGDKPAPQAEAQPSFAAEDDFDAETWARGLIADSEAFETAAEIDAFFADAEAKARHAKLERENPTIAKELVAALRGRKKALVAKEQAQ